LHRAAAKNPPTKPGASRVAQNRAAYEEFEILFSICFTVNIFPSNSGIEG
jgi:hypothetical protein